jgi:hypothetical protein
MLVVLLLIAFATASSGCTFPPPGVPAPIPGGPATSYPSDASVPDLSGRPEQFTPEQRIGISHTVTDTWSPLRTGDLTADAQSLLQVILKTPGFADAGIGADGSVWARYADGLPITWILAYNDHPEPGTEPSSQPSLVAPPAPKVASLPDHPDAAVWEFPSPYAGGVGATVNDLLSTAKYRPRILGNQVAELQTAVKNLGVLFAETHGGVSRTMLGTPEYALATDEPWKAGPEHLPKFELYRQGLLVPAVVAPLLGEGTYYWGINTAFVAKYWTFAADALVFFSACGVYASTEGRAFVAAIQNGSPGRSATVLGWDGSVLIAYGSRTAKKFFARVLGDNSIDNEDVPRRPFTYKQVYDWMAKDHEIQMLPGTATLTITYGPAGDGQLVPSILRVNLLRPGKEAKVEHPGEEYLEIAGSFGPDPGPDLRSVTLGGQPLNVYDNGWSPERILAKVPAGQAITAIGGDLVVTVRNHPSNPVPITHWTGSVKSVQTVPGSRGGATLTLDCRLQASGEVHFFRTAPDATPRVSFVAPVDFPDGCHWRLAGHIGSCSISGSGRLPTTIQSGNLVTMGKRALNTDNDGHYPVQAFAIMPASKKLAIGTMTCSGSSSDYGAVPFYTGSYTNGEPITLPASMFVNSPSLSCRMSPDAPCTEKWTLNPTIGIPTKKTQA